MPPQEQDQLFESFIQTESGKKSQEGTGLGLTISRKFIQTMGGDITVASKLGKGTIFQFKIISQPPLEEELRPQRNQKVVSGLAPNQPTYRILVVDDRPENCQLMSQFLQPMGFAVKEANNGQEAIQIWQDWQPHLIWMDMRMPVMNGYEATRYIKSHLQGQATHIIALTASVFEEEKAIVLSAGCDDFVRKPFQEAEILDKLQEYLGVRYLYADKSQSISNSNQSDRHLNLDPKLLQVMSHEWLSKLKQAADQLDKEAIIGLVEQIPEQHRVLIQAIYHQVDNFDYEAIVNSIEETLDSIT